MSALALKLWEAAEALDQRLDDPAGVLDLLVSAVAKGEQPTEPWQRLHDAAVKYDRVADLAFAYEGTASDKRIKLMPPEQQAYVHLQAATFFNEAFGDREGAAAAAERALVAVPGHSTAFALLERLLTNTDGAPRLAQHYADASHREPDPERKLSYLRRALELLQKAPRTEDQIIDSGLRILKLDPADDVTRETVMRRLIERGRHKEVVELLESALKREPPPDAAEAKQTHEFLLDLCSNVLRDSARALTHVEGLLKQDPLHEQARSAAEALLEHRQFGPRAAALMSDAFEAAGEVQRAIGMLSIELKQVRGPRRVEVQRRLGILRQDAQNDPAGALELLAPVVAGDPGDDALRRRFVDLSLSLNQPAQAARLLARALQTSRDAGVRARVAADVGKVYLQSGDVKKAQVAFQQALEIAADDGAMLEAARRLAELYTESGDLKQLSSVLEVVVRLETEREACQAAARRLARLCDNEVPDTARAIVAFRALVGSPWTDEALRRLEGLYGETHDDDGLADVLAHRAERSKDPAEARELAFKAAELRSVHSRDRGAAIAAWQNLANKYGASALINERLIPLLEQEARWGDVVGLLRKSAEAAGSSAERLEILIRLGQLQLTHTNDAAQALATFREALGIDPGNRTVRSAIERLLSSGDARREAAEVLEPIYRDDEPGSGLIRVLELRSELDAEAQRGLSALTEAMDIAERHLRDSDRALQIAGRGLKQAVLTDRSQIVLWREHVQRLAAGNSMRRAALLDEALGGLPIDSEEMLELCKATGEALAQASEVARAVEVYRRAMVFAPSSRELVSRIDELLAQQGAPEERLQLYRSALEQELDQGRRRELRHALALLEWRELRDHKAAIATWQAAVHEDPRDMVAHDALIAAFSDAGDWAGVYHELLRVAPHLDGDRRVVVALRLAEVALQRGDHPLALAHYRELLSISELSDDVLATIEQLAREQNDGATTRQVLERRLASTGEPQTRAGLLERLGNALAWQLGDNAEAARVWLDGARLSEGSARDAERARKLYERVLDADPDCREAAERLVEISAEAGDWDKLHEVFDSLLRMSKERELIMLVVGLEERAVESGKLAEYVRLIDLALSRIDPSRARHVLMAKARSLGTIPGQQAAAAGLYRELLASAGDEALPEADAFEAFLFGCPPDAARAADFRWLYQWRLGHTANAADVLASWARTEEEVLGDLAAAARLYEQLLTDDPERADALAELARLALALGDVDKALGALEALRLRSEGETRTAAELKIAGLLLQPLGRALEAVELVAPILEKNPSEADALRLLHRALSAPEARARAAELLERVAEAAGDAATRADVIEALLAVTSDAPELAAARSRWLTQLLKTKEAEPEDALRVALRGAEAAPAEEELWNVAEEITRRLNNPNPVAEAYERTLDRDLSPELADNLGRRMVEFYEEWFDDPERVVKLLERVLLLAPSAGWAFDRLKLAFNAAGRWSELFALYDRRLDGPIPAQEAIEILREAAMAAKDFAGDAERAIGYLERLNKQSPGDARVDAALERLYERHGHKKPLIELLSARLPALGENERGDLSGRIAALWLDLAETVPAYEIASKMLGSKGDEQVAVALLERTIGMPNAAEHKLGKKGKGGSVLSNAARVLKDHYRAAGSTVDVVRMLELEVECADERKVKVERLEEIVKLRLEALSDARGAFETVAQLLVLRPDSREYRAHFAELATQTHGDERRADVLIAVARQELPRELAAELLDEAAEVCELALGAPQRAADLYREVLNLRADNVVAGLHAGRRLAAMLRAEPTGEELVTVLEILATLEESAEAKRAVLGEAARLAFAILGDPERAIRDYRARLVLGGDDFEAVDGLCVALEAAQRWDELITALEQRATIAGDVDGRARADRVRIAMIQAETRGDRPRAIDAWRRVRELHGRDEENFGALASLLATDGRNDELAALVSDEVAHEARSDRRAALYADLGDLHEHKTGRPSDALEAYVSAGDWQRAIRVTGTQYQDRELGRSIAERLFELAVAAWLSNGDLSSDPARAADWALNELSQRLLEAGRYEDVVERLLGAAKLPFGVTRRRELSCEAACLAADRLGDAERAIDLFQALLAEDPADSVATSSVTRLALLLEDKGRTGDIVELWERQGAARAAAQDSSGAAVLWARAADLAEERLGDVDRAIKDHERGAALGGETSLEALARIHTSNQQPLAAAAALETLCAQSAPEALSERALRLAQAYTSAGQPEKARVSLERALPRAIETQQMRARLAELYREARDYTALAQLIAEEADRTDDRKEQLAHLREAALLHVEKRNDAAAAVPLLERAVELDPDDTKLRLKLSQSLHLCKRHDDAARVLRDQLARYGNRRPKDRAQVHFQLARVLLAASYESEALAELDTASRIDPAHPGIMQMLARVAFKQGELDRAERMYRALLLTAGRDDDPESPGKTEALVSLSEIAAQRGDDLRAGEFIESAFEAALENPKEATVLDQALRSRGRYDLLAKLLEARLSHGASPEDTAELLANLAGVHAEGLAGLEPVRGSLLAKARNLQQSLEKAADSDDRGWAALGHLYQILGETEAEGQVLEQRLNRSTHSTRPPADPDLFYRLAAVRLSNPEQREQGYELLERALDVKPDFQRAEKLLREASSGSEGGDPRAALLLERLARASGDSRAL
ncbi:MAG TPA: tetratricopeptide repeat protein, partial [Polyangiaceae bacterium]|nr:tetratricopeptide repeat protein [Polyangiaceae bacterium]